MKSLLRKNLGATKIEYLSGLVILFFVVFVSYGLATDCGVAGLYSECQQ